MLEREGIHAFGGPLGVMLMEHNRARNLIQEMSEMAEAYNAGSEDPGKRWGRAALDYSDLMHDCVQHRNAVSELARRVSAGREYSGKALHAQFLWMCATCRSETSPQ